MDLDASGLSEADILIHDRHNPVLANLLARMAPPDLPVALGVLLELEAPTYEALVDAEMESATGSKLPMPVRCDVDALLRTGHTWSV